MSVIDPVEVTFTTVSFVGWCVSIPAVIDAVADKRALVYSKINSIRGAMANANVRTECSRFIELLSFTVLGVLSLFAPNPTVVPPVRIIISWTLTAVVFLIAYNTYADRRIRKRLFAQMREHDKNV